LNVKSSLRLPVLIFAVALAGLLIVGAKLPLALTLNRSYVVVSRCNLSVDDPIAAPCALNGKATAELENALAETERLAHTPATMSLWARLLWARGQAADALRAWQQAVSASRDGRQRMAAFELGRAASQTGATSLAVSAFRSADAVFYLLSRADSFAQEGNLVDARRLADIAIQVEPSLKAISAAADIRSKEGDSAEARLLWLGLAERESPSSPIHWWATARAAILAEDWSAARNALESGLQLEQSFDGNLELGRICEQLQDWQCALSAYASAVQLAPNRSSEPYTRAARIEFRNGEPVAAMHVLDRGVSALPYDPWPNITACEFAFQLGDLVEAESRCRRALTQDPDHFAALYFLGQVLYRQGRQLEAVTYLETAIQPATNCEVLGNLVTWYAAMGEAGKSGERRQQFARECE
jgi:tetratricopeptide (TPR) repeat protein